MKYKNIFNDQEKPCPDCAAPLHVGQERFKDGVYMVEYCKQCGYRLEQPL